MATITVQEFATAIDTDTRTTRKFLRSVTPKENQPGKGSRWAIEKREVAGLKKKFSAWDEARRTSAEEDATDEVTE